MNKDIEAYNSLIPSPEKEICDLLATIIDASLPDAESKVWHRHPVWFLNGNPIAGYSKLKESVQLLFWSGQSFDEPDLQKEGTFKASQVLYTSIEQINVDDLRRWLTKARDIQWDYKDIVKRRGVLERLK